METIYKRIIQPSKIKRIDPTKSELMNWEVSSSKDTLPITGMKYLST